MSEQGSSTAGVSVLILVFLAGGLAGIALSARVAPESRLAAGVSVLALPAAMFCGFGAWFGFALALAPWRLLRGPRSSRVGPPPPGGFSLFLFSIFFSGLAGALSGALPGGWGLLSALGAYLGVGAVYSFSLWRLARSGVLPFPEGPA